MCKDVGMVVEVSWCAFSAPPPRPPSPLNPKPPPAPGSTRTVTMSFLVASKSPGIAGSAT